MRKPTGLILSVALCLVLSGSAGSASDPAYTVGDFAVGLAEMVTGRPDYTVEDAARMLRGMGYDIGEDLAAELRQQEFIDLLNRYGVELTSTNPDQVVTRDLADSLLGLVDAKGGAFTEAADDAIKCKGNPFDSTFNQPCTTDADCPGGFCNIPPGQAKKLASPSDP